MAEREQAHRHAKELKIVEIERDVAAFPRLGQWLGFLLAVVCLSASAYFFSIGNEKAGFAFIGALGAGILTAFVTGQISKREASS